MDLSTIFATLDEVESLRPAVIRGVDILNSYGPIVKQVMLDSSIAVADVKCATIKHLISKGFTRQEAIDLCMDEWYAFVRAGRSLNSTKSNK